MINSSALMMGDDGYTISRSVRLRSSASAYFNRTLGTPTDGKIWTWSGWVKRGALGSLMGLQHAYSATNNQGGIYINSSDSLNVLDYPTSTNCILTTTQVFRDPSAWYHIVIATDTTQATSSNRVKVYVNGVQVTSFSTATYPTQNTTFRMVASGNSGSVGRYYDGTNYYLDGYLTEINFIDGQALTPSSFGETDAVTGVWKPKRYTGTYGTNGFYLNFSDNTSTTTIGYDYSGNGNNWTSNNISVTSGVTYDSMIDSPTVSAVSSNYAVFNPLKLGSGGTWTVTNANLSASNSGSGSYSIIASSIGMSSGKWYFEFTATNVGSGGNLDIGVLQDGNAFGGSAPATSSIGQFANGYAYTSNGTVSNNNTNGSTYSSFTTNDVVQVALDLDNNKIYFGKNGTWQNSGDPTAGTGSIYTVSAGTYFAAIGRTSVSTQTGAATANFGQRPFSYTPPTGFNALNTFNLPTPTIVNGATVMAASLYTGTGSSQTISNAVNSVSFQPDWVWIKSRSGATNNELTDSVRGATKALVSNSTAAETTDTNGLTAFGSTGFTVGSDTNYNNNTATYVAWQWKAGGSSSSNTNGSITSTVSVNAMAGFSVVTWTGTGSNATVGHGLGVAPKMVIAKCRSTSALDWPVYHSGLASAATSIYLNLTQAAGSGPGIWNSTAPTSSVFSVGTSDYTNGSTKTYVAYCFSEVAGYSKFGSYTGNGSSDGPFIFTNMRPRFVMIKNTTNTQPWVIVDTARNTYNQAGDYLQPSSSAAENGGSSVSTATAIDILSNGFKLRNNASSSGYTNANGDVYVYAAFSESPFKLSLAR